MDLRLSLSIILTTTVYVILICTTVFDPFLYSKSLDLIGLDVMTAKRGYYAVIEINLCPALTIDNNLERIRAYALSHSF